jgi:DNA polymerase-3 subunit epsilon
MSWVDEPYVVLDVETSGFSHSSRILEIAAVTFARGEITRTFSQLLCPSGLDWEDEHLLKALESNHLTHEMLQDKPVFAEILPDLMSSLVCPVWVAHNLEFDLRMLRAEFERLDRQLVAPPLQICTMSLGSFLNTTDEGNGLEKVAARFQVAQPSAHRAEVDATVCGRILAAMIERCRLPTDDLAMADLCRKAVAHWRSHRRTQRSRS